MRLGYRKKEHVLIIKAVVSVTLGDILFEP